MPNLYLVRGLPGAGKTTLAGNLATKCIAADDYFDINFGGEFKPHLLGEAHSFCKLNTEAWMQEGHDVAVHNTFTQEWEMEPYYNLAEEYGYNVFSIIVENRHGNSSVHNVPEKTIEKMRNRFEVKLC